MALLSPLNPAAVVRAVRRGVLSATARLRPDHRAITMRAVRFSPDNAIRLYLYVVVAPNRFAPRPFDDGQVRRAQGFVAEAFPSVFEPTPRTADESTTLFTVEGDDGYREHQLYVHRTGLVELLWALTYEDDGDALTIDPVEMAYIVMRAAQAVARKPYTEVSRAGRRWRRFARVDWWFQAGTRISGANGPRSWTALRFPGQTPPRAHHDWAVAPPSGYGFQRLVDSRRRRAPEE